MPRDGFAFAVFIGSEPDLLGGFGGFFKIRDDLVVIRVNFIGNVKSFFVDFGILANMANRSHHFEVFTEIFFDSFGFGGGLNNN